jgi:anti-sigma regulatory factor (Ser/Thr protein kinase)
MEMSPDRIDEVRMAVVEACVNAFEHSKSRDRKVNLTFSVLGDGEEPRELRIVIEDAGVGFSPEDVEEPRIEEKIKAERKRGWGLKIIRSLMDSVEIRSGSNGTTLVMSKLRDSGD